MADGCCSGGCSCAPAKEVVVDFLYIDLTVCDRCLGTEAALDAAVAAVAPALKAAGYAIRVSKQLISSPEQAMALGFVSSPTIRVNGRDIADADETRCDTCGSLCGCDVDCRVWHYDGETYDAPPKELIAEALLKLFSLPPVSPEPCALPDNLAAFFQGR
jgi:predicted nucleic acid-binding Zn ribbon protein